TVPCRRSPLNQAASSFPQHIHSSFELSGTRLPAISPLACPRSELKRPPAKDTLSLSLVGREIKPDARLRGSLFQSLRQQASATRRYQVLGSVLEAQQRLNRIGAAARLAHSWMSFRRVAARIPVGCVGPEVARMKEKPVGQ